jgi:hypothetical protein
MILTVVFPYHRPSALVSIVILFLFALPSIVLTVWGARILSREADPTSVKGLLLIVAAVLLPVLVFHLY